jgi:thioredoxin reductase
MLIVDPTQGRESLDSNPENTGDVLRLAGRVCLFSNSKPNAAELLRDVAAGNGAMRLPVRGLFLADDEVPYYPEGLPGDTLDPAGSIRTQDGVSTGLRGMFAAGDVRAGSVPYAISAAADGTRAALAAAAFLSAL